MLGVTDVLRVEIEPCQLQSLMLIEQLKLLRYTYEDTVDLDRARFEAMPEFAREAHLRSVVEAEMDVSEFGPRALDIIRAQVPDNYDG